MEQIFNNLLSTLVVEYHKLQGYHWYIKGSDFFNIHSKLEEYYDEFLDFIDRTAEGMLMNNFKPVTDLKDFVENSRIHSEEITFLDSKEVFQKLITEFNMLLDMTNAAKMSAENNNLTDLEVLTDDLISFFKKSLWMLKQSQ